MSHRDLKLSQIRRVTLHWRDGGPFDAPTSYLIPASEVDRFVEASKRLHFKPGKNPHNGGKTKRIWRITVAELELHGPFWWTTPDLMENGDPAGAHTLDSYHEREVWADEETRARWRAEEERAEYEFEMRSIRRRRRAQPQGDDRGSHG